MLPLNVPSLTVSRARGDGRPVIWMPPVGGRLDDEGTGVGLEAIGVELHAAPRGQVDLGAWQPRGIGGARIARRVAAGIARRRVVDPVIRKHLAPGARQHEDEALHRRGLLPTGIRRYNEVWV